MRPVFSLVAAIPARASGLPGAADLANLVVTTLTHTQTDFVVDLSGGVLDRAVDTLLQTPRDARLLKVWENKRTTTQRTRAQVRLRRDLDREKLREEVFKGGKRPAAMKSLEDCDVIIYFGRTAPFLHLPESVESLRLESLSDYDPEILISLWLKITEPFRRSQAQSSTPVIVAPPRLV